MRGGTRTNTIDEYWQNWKSPEIYRTTQSFIDHWVGATRALTEDVEIQPN